MVNPSASQQTKLVFLFKENGENIELIRIEPYLVELDLILIESSLPQILAAMVIKCYEDGICEFNKLSDWLETANPLGFNQSLGHKFYEYKLKKLLTSFAEDKLTYDYKLQANYLLQSAKLVLSKVTFTSIDGLSITVEIKIDYK